MTAGTQPPLLPDHPHHDGSSRYAGTDRPSLGDTVPVWLRVPRGQEPDGVWVRSPQDGEPEYVAATVDRADEHATWFRADVDVVNPVTRYRWLLSDGPAGRYGWVNGTGWHGYDVPDAHDFALSAHPAPPAWASDARIYQIFPDRFARSAAADTRPLPAWAHPAAWDDPVDYRLPGVTTQVYGGDLDGIVDHLDHVVDLGFDTLYLTPFFPADSVHRYNAASFDRVDPLLGGDEALARLTSAAHARGVRVLGDLTTNHSGSTHEWFLAAQADPAAAERAFYHFRPDGSYVGWFDLRTLPKLRYGPELRRRLLEGPDSVVGRWLQPPYALDGWRVDVANMTGRHAAEDTNLEVARAMRATMAALDPELLLVAEHCHDASGDLSGEGWHGAMNYSGVLRPIWAWLRAPSYVEEFLGVPAAVPRLPGDAVATTMRAFQAVTPWRSLLTSWSLIGSHDTPRVRTVLGDADTVGVAAGLLFTLPGAPMVFMGDELGGQGVVGEDARRPMPWHRPQAWDRVTLERYRTLAHLRASSVALRRGGIRWVAAGPEVLAFVREHSEESLLCVATRGRGEPWSLPATRLGLGAAAELPCVYGDADSLVVDGDVDGDGRVVLPVDGPSCRVWRLP